MRRGFTLLLVIVPSLTYLAASNVPGAALVTKQSFC
jgi:hypothetical protein